MISPLLRTRRMPAKQVKLMFIIYVIRHTLGTLAFAWMTSIGLQVGGVYSWLFPILGVAYLATAVYNGNKLFQQFRRAGTKEKQEAATHAAP